MIPSDPQSPVENPEIGAPDLTVDDGNGDVEDTFAVPPERTGVDDGPEESEILPDLKDGPEMDPADGAEDDESEPAENEPKPENGPTE